MKSPPSRGSDAPHVHSRLRKHLSRCTLDCGFKTSESPALRGFEAERCPIRGTSLYLVLKSNGPHRSKNFPVKFDFSPKTVPQLSPKSYRHNAVSNRFLFRFSTSLTNAPHSLSRVKAGTHSAFGERSHTAAHMPKHGRFGWGWYHYPRTVPHVHKHPRAGYQNGILCRFGGLVGGAPKERRKPSEQRCAYARRCPEGVAAPLGCVIFIRMLIALLGGPVANFPALWYDKFDKLESVMH